MSVDTAVIFSRASIVTPVRWQVQISEIEPSMSIDTEIDLLDFVGFLPCKLFGQDCGFEYCVEELGEDLRNGLGPHVASDWDSVLTLATRSSFADCQSAVIAAAAFAMAVGGGVVGDDDEVLDRSTTLQWARSTVGSLKSAEVEDKKAQARREAAEAAGSDSVLSRTLSELEGRRGNLICQMGMLAFASRPDASIRSGAWKVEIGGRELNSCRYASLRDEQIELLSSGDGTGRIHEIEERLDDAGALDEADAEGLANELAALGELSIASARYEGSGQLVLELEGPQAIVARWYGIGTSSLSLNASGLRWAIRKDGVSLL